MAFDGLGPIGQIHVSVTDVDRAVAFYRDVLGIPFLFRVPGQPMAFFDCDGVRLYLGKPETAEFRSNPVLYFRVDDIDEAHRALSDRGVAFSDAPHIVHRTEDAELWMVAFKDPDDNNLILMTERPVGEVPPPLSP
jgi:catechol 2,3-dioxygenase-like lactoylglutathione lyase family enzyme